VDAQRWRSRVHLVPFFGNLRISEITAGKIQEYRVHRHQEAMANRGKPLGRSTLHQEIVSLRQTLKTAVRHGWLDRLPDVSGPYRSSPKSPTGRGLSRIPKLYEGLTTKGRAWHESDGDDMMMPFNVYTLSDSLKPVDANGLTLVPNYTFDNVPLR
jgi:hypothetical protein